MSKVINIKLPKEYFNKDRHNRLEARLAKFDLKAGDTIRFHEWDPQTDKLSGKYFNKKVLDLHKIHKATKYWNKKDLDKYGLYIFELGEAEK